MMGDERVQTLQHTVERSLKQSMERQLEILGEELRLDLLRQTRTQEKGYPQSGLEGLQQLVLGA